MTVIASRRISTDDSPANIVGIAWLAPFAKLSFRRNVSRAALYAAGRVENGTENAGKARIPAENKLLLKIESC